MYTNECGDSNIIGNKEDLFSAHGVVDIDKAIESLKFIANINTIDVNMVNESAEEGLLYLSEKGIPILGDVKRAERAAMYKIIPTCYTCRFDGRQVCASFLKTDFTWEGAFFGSLDKLIERIINNYSTKKITKNDRRFINRFKGNFVVKGHGLTEILEYNKNKDRILSTPSIAQSSSVEVPVIEKESVNMVDKTNNIVETSIAVKDTVDVVKDKEVVDIKHDIADFKSDHVITGDILTIYDDIYHLLLIKENWKSSNKRRLVFYIKSLLEKISQEQKTTNSLRGNGYILSTNRDKCLFNTGLIDIYSNDIYLVDLNTRESDIYKKKFVLVSSKAQIMVYGFLREYIINMPKAVKFYKDKGELIFDGSIEEFDLEDNYRLNHIIHERRGRFPEIYKDVPSDVLCDKIKSAVRKALRLSETDYKYIVPMYNLRMNKIQYLMPLHLDTSIEQTPELVIVVGEYNGFYCVFTILSTDDAYDNARLIARPDSNWLTVRE